MPSLEEKTERLIRMLGSPESAVNARQGDRVFNYHYDPCQWAEMRRQFPLIENKLERAGFTPFFHSFADAITEIFAEHPAIEDLISNEGTRRLPHQAYNEELAYLLTKVPVNHPLTLQSPIVQSVSAAIQFAANTPKSVVLLTDVEMLLPMIRVSAFEQILQGKFLVPTVIFYPGKKGTVGDNPAFLGIYKSDGNYRSTHIY